MADPSNFDPRHFNKPARKYMKQVCLDRYQQFWAAGNASKIQQQSITYYAGLYAKGALIRRLPSLPDSASIRFSDGSLRALILDQLRSSGALSAVEPGIAPRGSA